MPPPVFFLQISLAVQDLLWFHTKDLFLLKKCQWNFDRDRIELFILMSKFTSFYIIYS